MRSQWQIDQGKLCPCGGSDEYCRCQNEERFAEADREVGRILNLTDEEVLKEMNDTPLHDAEKLLDWLTHNHLPLSIIREFADEPGFGEWVVVDASNDTVKGSGETVLDALCAAYENQ